MAKEQHFQKTLKVFHGYDTGVKLLGPPIKIKRMDLGKTDTTWMDGLNARVSEQ